MAWYKRTYIRRVSKFFFLLPILIFLIFGMISYPKFSNRTINGEKDEIRYLGINIEEKEKEVKSIFCDSIYHSIVLNNLYNDSLPFLHVKKRIEELLDEAYIDKSFPVFNKPLSTFSSVSSISILALTLPDNILSSVKDSTEIGEFKKELSRKLSSFSGDYKKYVYPVEDLRRIDEFYLPSIYYYDQREGDFFGITYSINTKLNFEIVVFYFLTMCFISILLYYLPKTIGAKGDNDLKTEEEELTKSYDPIFTGGLIAVRNKANELYNRSNLLLLSGLIVALMGIVVFFFTMPDLKEISELINATNKDVYFIFTALRPVAILIFIESIAFFLLRQYRILINDFKYFYEIFLKRINEAISYELIKASRSSKDSSRNDLLISKLLESSETINNPSANLKEATAEENPNQLIQNAINTLSDIIKKTS